MARSYTFASPSEPSVYRPPTFDGTRLSESEFKIEWLYSNLRWFYLMAVAAMLGIQASFSSTPAEEIFSPSMIGLLATGALANLLVMLMLMLNAFRRPMAAFTLLLDTTLTLGFIILTGGPQSPLIFVAFIPIITAALRYPWGISVAVTSGIVLAYWLLAWQGSNLHLGSPFRELWIAFLSPFSTGLVLLIAGIAVSRVSFKMKENLLAEQAE